MSVRSHIPVPLAFAISLLCMLDSPAQPSMKAREDFVRSADSLIRSEVASGRLPGAVLLAAVGKDIVLHRAYGFASRYDSTLRQTPVPEPMTTRHLFDIASLTKVVGTTTALMLLADRGRLSVDDPVYRHVPAFDTPEKRAITIRHLLTHRSGMLDWYPMYYRASNRSEVYRLIAELPLRSTVGEVRRYSDLGFTILGQIVENASGEPLDAFLLRHVFQPLGMRHTLFNPLRSNSVLPMAATSHGNPFEFRMVHDSKLGFSFPEIDPGAWNGWRRYTLIGEVNDGNAWYAGKGVCGAAGLFSTASDLSVLVGMLLSGGMHEGRPFLSRNTVDAFLMPDRDGQGLGWMMDPSASFMKDAPAGSFGHTGFTGTSIAAVPSSGMYVILLANRQHRGLLPSGEYPNLNALRRGVFALALRHLHAPR